MIRSVDHRYYQYYLQVPDFIWDVFLGHGLIQSSFLWGFVWGEDAVVGDGSGHNRIQLPVGKQTQSVNLIYRMLCKSFIHALQWKFIAGKKGTQQYIHLVMYMQAVKELKAFNTFIA